MLDELAWEEAWWPHWISIEPEGNRVVLTSGKGATQYKVLLVKLDPETGALEFDSTLSVSFDRSSWPHGEAGAAKPHGAVFSRVR